MKKKVITIFLGMLCCVAICTDQPKIEVVIPKYADNLKLEYEQVHVLLCSDPESQKTVKDLARDHSPQGLVDSKQIQKLLQILKEREVHIDFYFWSVIDGEETDYHTLGYVKNKYKLFPAHTSMDPDSQRISGIKELNPVLFALVEIAEAFMNTTIAHKARIN